MLLWSAGIEQKHEENGLAQIAAKECITPPSWSKGDADTKELAPDFPEQARLR
jgi:hypothetical protein